MNSLQTQTNKARCSLACYALSNLAQAYGIITIIDEFIMDAVALFNIINMANAAWSDCEIARSQKIF